jgi:hypothetical protein
MSERFVLTNKDAKPRSILLSDPALVLNIVEIYLPVIDRVR